MDVLTKPFSYSRYKRLQHLEEETFEIELEDPNTQPFFVRENPDTRFRFTNTSIYSSGCVDQSEFTASLISSYFHTSDVSSIVVTDATSCIGGNTWAFAKHFKKVNAVEIHPLHFEILTHNMKELHLDRKINFYLSNYLEVYSNLQQDVVFIDPPWGGMKYRSSPQVGLYNTMDHFIPLPRMLSEIEFGESTKLIVLKVPKNYSTFGLKKEGFPFKKVVSLRTTLSREVGRSQGMKDTLYKLVCLSSGKERRVPDIPCFSRVGYRSLRFKRLEQN